MKYLKAYKLFESFNEDIIAELNDILLELSDLGYFVDLREIKGTGVLNPDKIRVFIGGIGDSNFTYDDVKEVFERMTDYMESEGFTILNLFYSTPEDPNSHFMINLKDYKNGVLSSSFFHDARDKVGFTLDSPLKIEHYYIFHHLQISFTPK